MSIHDKKWSKINKESFIVFLFFFYFLLFKHLTLRISHSCSLARREILSERGLHPFHSWDVLFCLCMWCYFNLGLNYSCSLAHKGISLPQPQTWQFPFFAITDWIDISHSFVIKVYSKTVNGNFWCVFESVSSGATSVSWASAFYQVSCLVDGKEADEALCLLWFVPNKD